ncbi:unnamed protein product [Effrenium voratum]|nr:unnamed protein product [Effrenium voratum]
MSLIDSTAAFKAHCDKIDDAGNLWNLVRSNGLRSMSQLAFAIGTPQSPPTEQEFKDFCRNINEGVDLALGLFAQMRRLHFEASTMIVAHLRSQVSQESGQEGVRKLPNAEKVARLERQQARLNGVSIKGELQPSHALIDLVASMCDTNSVIWVAPSKCSKREREVQQLTKEKTPVLTVEQHMLKFSGPDEEISVDTSTELHWQWAMQRRGIALDQVLAVDHSAERAHGIHIANFDLAVDAQVNGLIEFLQQEEDNLAWIHFAPACGTASFAVHLPAEVVRVLEENVSDEDFALAKKRVAYLCRWTKRAQELGAEEQNLKKAMPGHQCLNASILAQLENADDRDATNQQAWRQTLEEIEKGYVWLDDDADPYKHALAKRFGLNQKNKVRVIDDCTVGGLNKTIGVVEKRVLASQQHNEAVQQLPVEELLAARDHNACTGQQAWPDASHLFGFEYLAEADLAKAVVYLSPLRAKQNTLPCYAPAWRIVCKRRLMRPLVPEFKDFLHVPTEVTQPGWPCDDDGAQPAPIKRLRQMYKYGVQWSPQEFFAQAKQVLHPRDPQSALLDCTKQAIFDNLTMSAVELAKLRLRAVLMIKGVVSDLEDQERQLKASMEPGVSAILSSKKILAWQALLEASHYEDMQVVELVKQGITLDGVHSCPPCYPPDWKPATLDSQDLLDTAVWRRRVLVAECDDGDTARQQDVHETTLAEVELGHLQGPFTEQQISEHFGTDHWLLNPRFAIYQGEEKKVRIIDDCRRSSLNSTYSVNFRLELMDVDTLACLIGTIGESIAAGTALLSMADGTVLRGDVVEAAAKGSWMGRTVDLSKAYKQLAAEVQGHLNFASGFYVSRALGFLVASFDRMVDMPAISSEELRQLCDLAMCMLRSLKPRVYSVVSVKLPILIFTDGAWESGVASAGVAMYFPQEGGGVVAPIAVPDELVKLWLDEVGPISGLV